jgi:tRNA (cmo5U34)-methyltransferase
MTSRLNGFDLIAARYDFLKNVIFGKSIHESQLHFLGSIPAGSNILILGGGSGEILPPLMAINPGCKVRFVEASSAMLRLARKRIPAQLESQVEFIHGTELTLSGYKPGDVVITNFFLDLFPEPRLSDICGLIGASLRSGGLWLVSDFVNGLNPWQRFLLWFMYRFFRLSSGIEAERLPEWQTQVLAEGMEEVSSQTYYGGFIKSVLYHKKV